MPDNSSSSIGSALDNPRIADNSSTEPRTNGELSSAGPIYCTDVRRISNNVRFLPMILTRFLLRLIPSFFAAVAGALRVTRDTLIRARSLAGDRPRLHLPSKFLNFAGTDRSIDRLRHIIRPVTNRVRPRQPQRPPHRPKSFAVSLGHDESYVEVERRQGGHCSAGITVLE